MNVGPSVAAVALAVLGVATLPTRAEEAVAVNYPHVTLSAGRLVLQVALPDAAKGFYRGTRFDWSGIITDARWDGVPLLGTMHEKGDPSQPVIGTGTMEEFDPDGPPTYAGVDEPFLKIGVGILRRIPEEKYNSVTAYPLLDGGTWSWEQAGRSITFHHRAGPVRGVSYELTKRVVLGEEPGTFSLEYRLHNTGSEVIETDHYGHNFIRIANRTVGPGYFLRVPPDLPLMRLGGTEQALGLFRGKLLFDMPMRPESYTQVGVRTQSMGPLRLWQADAELGLEIVTEGDVRQFVLYATPEALCPENYVHVRVPPGGTATWATRYRVLTQAPEGI